MPQSKEKQREQARVRKQRQRDKERDIGGRDTDSVTETVPASYVMGLDGKMYEALPERERYLELSDGQVLDRLNQPEAHASGDFIQPMRACNEGAYNYRPNESSKERVKAMVKEATNV